MPCIAGAISQFAAPEPIDRFAHAATVSPARGLNPPETAASAPCAARLIVSNGPSGQRRGKPLRKMKRRLLESRLNIGAIPTAANSAATRSVQMNPLAAVSTTPSARREVRINPPGAAAASTIRTLAPASARYHAVVRPESPAPTTIASGEWDGILVLKGSAHR